jgi:molybdopterin/thiamine biosynthesis adenylyltransferase
MDDRYKAIFCRNIGFFTESEQDKLRQSAIAVAGMGGVGGLLAERLVRLGVGQLKITDNGTFEESNLNRQFASSMTNLDQNKAEVVLAQIKDINPQAQIHCSNTGITTENDASLFVSDCDLVIDEMDYVAFKQSILLQRAARDRGTYYLFSSAIGFGALVVIFDPQGLTLEEYNKLPPGVDLNDAEKLKVPLDRSVPIIPSYAAALATAATVEKIAAGVQAAPTTSIGAGLASILAANEAINIILNKGDIVKAPGYIYIDLFDRQLVVGAVS